MHKKNLPNIPIYIGDWMKDCACLSMEAQGAWLQIIFKLWTNGKQNDCKIKAKSLQKLWKCSSQEVIEIVEELIEEDICILSEINIEGAKYYHFTCRRFVKENKISKIRSKAAKSDKEVKKEIQSVNKNKAKDNQITENEIDYENDIVIENIELQKKWLEWKKYRKAQFGFEYKTISSEKAAITILMNTSNQNEELAIKIINQSMANSWKGFFKIKDNGKSSSTKSERDIEAYQEFVTG